MRAQLERRALRIRRRPLLEHNLFTMRPDGNEPRYEGAAMSLRDMPVVTVEQIVRFRDAALGIEQQRDDLLEALKEYLEAADETVHGVDDVAAMIRYGDAVRSARAIIAKIESQQ